MNAKEMYGQLLNLRNSAGELYHERIALASRLMQCKEWVEDPTQGGGDVDKALARLEQDCLGDVIGVLSLVQLLEIYHAVPDIKEWKRYKFDIKRMWGEWKAKQQPRRKAVNAPRTTPSGLYDPIDLASFPPGELRREYERAYKAVQKDEAKIESLQERCDRLEEENKQLRAENARLKRIIDSTRKVFAETA